MSGHAQRKRSSTYQPNDRLDLVLERVVDLPVEQVWVAWTDPERLEQWFTPEPWQTVGCEIDLRPGGIFRTVMRSPEGEDSPGVGCYLEVVENERLVWTNALEPGYRPAPRIVAKDEADCHDLLFTAMLLLEAQGERTKYTAIAMHETEDARRRHEEMGFHEGWGKALDQLVATARR